MGIDDDLWWFFCGTECEGQFIGPFEVDEDAWEDIRTSGCNHDHAMFRMTLRQMAAKMPPDVRWWVDGIYDPRPTPSRRLVKRPYWPRRAADRWHPYFAALTELKRSTTCV
jgi:hypothetical protein